MSGGATERTAAESAHPVHMARAAAARLGGDPNRRVGTARSDFDLGPLAYRQFGKSD